MGCTCTQKKPIVVVQNMKELKEKKLTEEKQIEEKLYKQMNNNSTGTSSVNYGLDFCKVKMKTKINKKNPKKDKSTFFKQKKLNILESHVNELNRSMSYNFQQKEKNESTIERPLRSFKLSSISYLSSN